MNNVVNISAKAVTPRQVIETALELEDLSHAYVVVVRDGELTLFGSGDLSMLPAASIYMQHFATKYARGEIE